MIGDIEIRDLGVIEHAELPLGAGFTAVTGETGAGKTMLVTALTLLLGGRGQAGAIRQGADRAKVTGRWIVPAEGPTAELVDEAGGELEPIEGRQRSAELLVVRQLAARDGRSRAWLGGAAVPVATLTTLGEQLVAVHGQSEQLRLRTESAQREALDEFAGNSVLALRNRVAATWRRVRELRALRHELDTASEQRTAELAALQEFIAEFEAVSPEPDEDASLLTRIERLEHREELRRAVGESYGLIRGEGGDSGEEFPGAAGLLADAVSRIERARQRDPGLVVAATALGEASIALDEAALQLSGYLDGLDLEGVGELDALNERLALIVELTRHHGADLAAVLERYQRAGARLLELEGHDQRRGDLDAQLSAAEDSLTELTAALTAERRRAAATLSDEVSGELTQLAMPHARLQVEVTEAAATEHGADQIAFLLQPHPGSPPAPIQKGASGGELSRIMLALEVVLASANPVPTLVFDEVDAGVGGAAAIEIGRRLRRLAEHAQVIVVTHLAQVAAFANNHVLIEKTSDGQVTTSAIRRLQDEERVAEISRLLSGLGASDTGRAHAEELLRLAAT